MVHIMEFPQFKNSLTYATKNYTVTSEASNLNGIFDT